MNGDSSRPGPRIAPPPPPPADVALAMGHGETPGYQPHQGRHLAEFGVVALVFAVMGGGAYFLAGHLAAAATPLVSLEVDRRLGELSVKQLGIMEELCPPALQTYVETVAAPLLQAAGKTPFSFQFRVVRDPSVNAFALPGGYVTVNSGLLDAAESGEEVAGVLGHELQHALLRHGTRRMLRQLGGGALLGLLLGGGDVHGLSDAAGQLTSLAYDREQESEADREGVALLVRAGIDPRGLSRFFERLASDGELRPPAWLSTHPEPESRSEWVAKAAHGAFPTHLPKPPHGQCGEPAVEPKP